MLRNEIIDNCWDILRNCIPAEAIYKALPGWCFLSRKHAQSILNLPSQQLNGLNLWPAFKRVWAPEEVYFPTALSLCGHMAEVSMSRTLTHSHWDERAANHRERAHPIAYDGHFNEHLVSKVRRDGCLFMRKFKRSLDVSLWEQIVVQHKKGSQMDDVGRATVTRNRSEQDSVGKRERKPEMMRAKRGIRGQERESRHDHGEIYDNRSYYHFNSTRYDSRRGHHYDSRSSPRKRQR